MLQLVRDGELVPRGAKLGPGTLESRACRGYADPCWVRKSLGGWVTGAWLGLEDTEEGTRPELQGVEDVAIIESSCAAGVAIIESSCAAGCVPEQNHKQLENQLDRLENQNQLHLVHQLNQLESHHGQNLVLFCTAFFRHMLCLFAAVGEWPAAATLSYARTRTTVPARDTKSGGEAFAHAIFPKTHQCQSWASERVRTRESST